MNVNVSVYDNCNAFCGYCIPYDVTVSHSGIYLLALCFSAQEKRPKLFLAN